MKVGISGECTLQRIDRGLRIAAVGQDEAEIGEDDRVAGFDALGGAKCFGGIIELALSGLTRGETQMCVGRGQLRVDRRAKSGGGVAATIRFEQHIAEPQVRLRVLWILGEDATQRRSSAGPRSSPDITCAIRAASVRLSFGSARVGLPAAPPPT